MITSGTFQFTHVGIHKCIDALENLRTLQIAATDEVNDTIVEVIGRRCQHLRCLWLNDCPNVTDACSDSLKSMELVELNLANTSVSSLHELVSIEMYENNEMCIFRSQTNC